MEVVCQSDYQDIYRIDYGVLLVINKFKYISFKNAEYPIVYNMNRTNCKAYKKGCQEQLKQLTKPYRGDEYHPFELPVGSVCYRGRPVKIVNQSEWNYQIKTTGEDFSGNRETILGYIENIVKIIKGELKNGNEM